MIPAYLEKTYWWAYVHPTALKFWDHRIPMNGVLFGNYNRLRDKVLDLVPQGKNVVQLGSCYGDLMPHLHKKSKSLTVVDCVYEQLKLAASKCECNTMLADAGDTGLPSGSADVVVIFFLLHELPVDARAKVLREAYRLAGTDGKVVICEFEQPKAWNLFGYIERMIFRLFEPFAKESLSWQWESGAARPEFGSLYRIIETDVLSAIHGASGPVAEAAASAASAIQADREAAEQDSRVLIGA